MSDDAFRCAESSEVRSEPLFGTASVVERWLLLEQPGAWGHDALNTSRLPHAIANALRARARSAGVRIVLIRKGARAFSAGHRQCYFARTEASNTYLAHLSVDSVDELLEVDLTPLREGGPIAEANEHPDPLFLVCTHGRHDACCAIRGNQVSRIACAREGADAWECSHIGGDRFAANLVCFPHGVYYGRVGTGDVGPLMDRYRAGTLSLEHYRGRCCYGFAVQAAEYFVRRETDLVGIDEVVLISSSSPADGLLRARFAVPGGEARVEIEVRDSPQRYLLTCGSRAPEAIPRYSFVSLSLQANGNEERGDAGSAREGSSPQ